MNSGAYVEPTRETVGSFLNRWLADYARVKVAPTTFERYEEIVRLHLIPVLGHHPLAKLQPLHIQGYYTRALKSGRRRSEGGLSAQTVLHHHRVLREALQQAVRWLLLARNPADAVEPPRPSRKETRVICAQEAAELLSHVEGTRLYVPVLLAVTTGMRRGEILGLRWRDVNFDASVLAVRQTLEETKGAGLRFKQPKTQKGRRTVALPAITVERLRQHRALQAETRLALGSGYQDGDLVCAMHDGTPWKPSNFSYTFRVVALRLGLTDLRFHDLRHSHATELLRSGIHPKIVSERLGHSTVGITLDTYSHVLPDMQEQAAATVDDALRRAMRGT